MLHKREHNTSMDEAYNKTLEMPHSDTKLPEQQRSKMHHNNKNNQTDTPPQIPSIKIVNNHKLQKKIQTTHV